MNYHATALKWKNTGMIFTGPSGCGKSTLALQLIARGATLIADDQIILRREHNFWMASCPEAIRNKIHIDGIGLLSVDVQLEMRVDMVFCSDRKAEKISRPPVIRVPSITMNFMSDGAVDFIETTLTSFDSSAIIPYTGQKGSLS